MPLPQPHIIKHFIWSRDFVEYSLSFLVVSICLMCRYWPDELILFVTDKVLFMLVKSIWMVF